MKIHYTILVAAALSIPATVHADEAQEHTDKALRAYNVQDWPTALAEYKKAYEADPKPDTLWAIAQTQRLSGDCRSAILTYRAFARTASANGATAADNFITQCEAAIAAQQKAVDEATKPDVTKSGGSGAGAGSSAATGTATPVPKPPKPAAEPRPWILDPLGDTLALIGIVGLVGGGTYFGLGDSEMSDAASKQPYSNYDTTVDGAREKQQVGVAVFAGGAVFAGLAIWRFVAVAGRKPHERLQAIVPGLVPGGAVVNVGGRF